MCAFAGGWVVVAAQALGMHEGWSRLAGAAVGSWLRALALLKGLRLPQWSSGGDAIPGPLFALAGAQAAALLSKQRQLQSRQCHLQG